MESEVARRGCEARGRQAARRRRLVSGVGVPASGYLEAVQRLRWWGGGLLNLFPLPPRKRDRGLELANLSVLFRGLLALAQCR